jgi:zinc transport system substrate-binding protein
MRQIIFSAILFFFATTLHATPKVVVTINPIFALTEGVMQGVAEPTLLVTPGASPHNYALKPSQVSALHNADLIIWVGTSLETFLTKTLSTLPANINQLSLLTIPGINPLLARRSDAWQSDEHDHSHHDNDPHIWLDPVRAQTIVAAITAALSNIDPQHKDQYQANAKRVTQELIALDQQLSGTFKKIQSKPFIVFHDAYQYLEKRYSLNAVGAVTVNPEIMPSVHHLNEIQQVIKKTGAVCIFAEPQFRPAIVDTIAKASGIKEGVLDPLGPGNIPGFAAYPALLTQLSMALQACLI